LAEAFVKTCKRDYLKLDDTPDEIALMQLPKWFQDYNEHHCVPGTENEIATGVPKGLG